MGSRPSASSACTASCTRRFQATTSSRWRYPAAGGCHGFGGPARLPRSTTSRPWPTSTGPMFATRSASGPMLAPRAPAPISVGAPIRLICRFMARGSSEVDRRQVLRRFAQREAVFGFQRVPRFLRGLDEAEKLEVHLADHPVVDEHLEIDQLVPE